MKVATISETKNHLSELLARVKRGESVLILDRARPVARLVPVESTGDRRETRFADHERLKELERAGVLRRAKVRAGVNFLASLPPPPKVRVDVVAALLAERDEGR
ncbi:MAG TPA: type II toxin-antitoxin system prevent-host-death family antitoxin [Casimicrobiaceae bacterium]